MTVDLLEGRPAPRGFNTVPCPGCGVKQTIRKGRVCPGCQAALARDIARQKQLAELGDEGLLPFECVSRAYALPAIYDCGRELSDNVKESFFNLAQLLSETTDKQPPVRRLHPRDTFDHVDRSEWDLWHPNGLVSGYRDWLTVRAFHKPVAQAIRTAYNAVRAAVEGAHAEGFKDGSNLLGQLASGRITMDKFNEITLREDGE